MELHNHDLLWLLAAPLILILGILAYGFGLSSLTVVLLKLPQRFQTKAAAIMIGATILIALILFFTFHK